MADIGIKISAIDDTRPAFDSVGRSLAGVQSGAKAAGKEVSQMGMSAAQTAAAMRNVPAQFTDIIVSLQSGQKPLTVLLQQGGQLKDMFGGVGNAARAMSTYVAGLVSPLTIAAGAVGAVALAYYKGSQESDAYNKALILTGNAAGTTSGKMADMAANMARFGTTQGAAAQALAASASTGQIAAANLEKYSLAAVKYASATGAALDDTVKQFAELGKSPLEASVNLNSSINHLTLSLYEQIKALDEQGKHTEAANLAQNAFADTITSRSAEMVSKLGLIERGWAAIKKAVAETVDAAAGVGRAPGIGEQIASQQQRVTNAQNNVDYEQRTRYGGPAALQQRQLELQAEREKLEVLREVDRLSSRAATARAQETLAVRAQIEFDKEADKYKTNAVKLQEALTKLAQQYAAVSHDGDLGEKNAAAYATAIEKIKDQYKDKPGPKAAVDLGTYDALVKSIREKIAVQEQELSGVEKLTKGEQDQAKFLADLRDGTAGLVVAHGKSVQTQAQEIVQLYQLQIGREKENALMLEAAAMREDAAKAYDAYNKKSAQEVDAINAKAQAVEDEVAAYGLTKDALRQLTIARLEDQAAQITRFEPSDVAQKEVAAIEARIAAIRRLGNAETALEQKDTVAKAAKHAEQQWQKAADEINRAVTDALMRGFENGKGFAENFRDTVENIFKTMVLRPVVQATVNSGLAAIGIPGVGGSSGGAGGLLNTASSANSLYGNLSSFFGGGAASSIYALGGVAPGASALLPTVTTLGVESGLTAAGTSIYSLAAPAATGLTLPTFGASLGATGAAGVGSTVAATSAAGGAGALAAVPGWGWALGGALLLGGLMGGNKNWETKYGGSFDNTGPDGAINKISGPGTGGEFPKEYAQKALKATEVGINETLKLLGSQARLGYFSAGAESSGEGQAFANSGGKLKLADGTLVEFGQSSQSGGYLNRRGNMSADEAAKAYGEELQQATLQALQTATDIPKAISAKLAGVDVDALTGDALSTFTAEVKKIITDANALQSAMALLPFGNLKDLSFDAASGLLAAAGGFDKLNANITSYYDAYYSAEEKRAQTVKNLTQALGTVGLSLPATREAFRALVDAQDVTTEAGQKAYAALMDVNGAFASITSAAEDAAKAIERTNAQYLATAQSLAQSGLDSLQRSIEAQRTSATAAKDVAAQSVQELTALVGTLQDAVQGLRGASQPQQSIAAMLQAAQATGYLPSESDLRSAISASVQDVQQRPYASAQEAEFARATLASQLSDLQGIGGDQLAKAKDSLTIAQQQLDQLDSLERVAKQQLDAANGTYSAILSLSDAIKASTAATQDLMNVRASQGLTTGAVTVGGALQSVAPDTGRLANINKYINTLDFSEAGAANSVQQLYAAAQQYGVNQAELAAASGYRLDDVQKLFAKYGIPSFDVGTNYVPRDMLAFIHEGEEIKPRAYNPAAGGGGNNDKLLAELIGEIRRLRSQVDVLTEHGKRTADATNGRPDSPVLVEIA